MDDAVGEAHDGADGENQKHGEETEIVLVHAVEDRHRQDHRGEGEHAFDRQVDRSHQDDESFAEAENERNCGVLAHPHEIAEGQENCG